jgi:hypothetical protein
LANGCNRKKPDAPVHKSANYHYLIIGKHLQKQDGCLVAKNEHLDYRVMAFINDNPVCNIKESTGIFAINPLIKPGENHIKIRMEGSQPIEVAVTATPDFSSQAVLGRIQYDPNTNNSLECDFTFSADIDYTLPIYKPENHLVADEKEIKVNVLKLLELVLDALGHTKMKKAASILFEGERIYSPSAIGISPVEIDKSIEMYGTKGPHSPPSGSIQYQQYEPEKYIIKCGPNLILVYRNDYQHIFRKEGFESIPVTIAYVDGKYIFWEVGEF